MPWAENGWSLEEGLKERSDMLVLFLLISRYKHMVTAVYYWATLARLIGHNIKKQNQTKQQKTNKQKKPLFFFDGEQILC